MQQIKIRDDALPILRAGITLQKKLTNIKTKKYSERLRKLEERHNMRSEMFIKEFEAGNLGDDAEWFDWVFVWEAYKKTVEREKIIDSLSI